MPLSDVVEVIVPFPPGVAQIVLPVNTRGVGRASPVAVSEIVGELLEALVAVMVALWLPTPVGVKVTTKVAVPPSPLIVVEESPETTSWELFEVTETAVAVAFVFVIVYVTDDDAIPMHKLPKSVGVPVIANTAAIAGTSSPVGSRIGVPVYPVNLISDSCVEVKVPVAAPKNTLPAVPVTPGEPVHPLIVKIFPAVQLIPELFAKVNVCVLTPKVREELSLSNRVDELVIVLPEVIPVVLNIPPFN